MWQSLWTTSIFASPGQASFLEVLISLIAPNVVRRICVYHIYLWAIAVCKLPSQTDVVIMPTNKRPETISVRRVRG